MEPREQPNWDAPLSRFLDYVLDKNCAFEVVEPEDPEASTPPTTRPFMPLNQIQDYFKDQGFSELRAILDALFSGEFMNPKDIFPRYTAVFCTLICIGRGRYIKHFKHHGSLSDINLPFDPQAPPPHAPSTPGDPNFWHNFCKAQWKFCAQVLEDLSDKHFDNEQILPIIAKKRLAGGGSANIWLVKIHPFYNKLIKDQAKIPLREDADTFVLKEYSTADARKYYENETAAFDKVGSENDNIIKYYGSFIRGDTFNLLLEYADKGTLRRVFEEEDPPTSSENIIQFWEEILKLISSLSGIHAVKPFTSGGPQIFQGWHQDVKPENILVVSNGKTNPHEWKYKLADLGLSHFKMKTSLREDSTASDTYGTRTYGAPECSRPDLVTEKSRLKVEQNIDIWSLGCVYSEVIRWLAQGRAGVKNYRDERKTEIGMCQYVGAVDCFHNGVSALNAVRKSHEVSVDELRRTDFITGSVVHMVNDMLVVADERPSAHGSHGLWRKQLRILDDARKSLADNKISTPSSGLTVNTNERTQSRSHTHPSPGPSSISPRNLPPNLPPGFTTDSKSPFQNHAHCVQTNTPPDLGQRQGNSSFLPEDDSFKPLFQEPPTVEYSNENASLRQHKTHPNASYHTVPITSPLAQSPLSIVSTPEFQNRKVLEGPESLFGNTAEEGLPVGTRGSPHTPESPSSRYSATSPGLGSVAGSLGHNSRPRHRANNLDGNSGYRQSTSTFDRQTNPPVDNFDAAKNSTISFNQRYRSESSRSQNPPVLSNSPPPNLFHHHSGPGLEPPFDQQPQRPEIKKPRSPREIANSRVMSIREALDWKRDCKSTKTDAIGMNKSLRHLLNGRDHVFLIDDSYSMAEHWDSVVTVFEALSYVVKATDKDGLDLFFTISTKCAKGVKETSKLIPLVKAVKNHIKGATCDIDFQLTEILRTYTERLSRAGTLFGRKPKPLSLYILTDGMWEYDAALEPIKNAVLKLSDARRSRQQIGIQFIRFGNNPGARLRLEDLDHGFNLPNDIVDTEPFDGNVWKMLLGPISPQFDGDNAHSPRLRHLETLQLALPIPREMDTRDDISDKL